MKSRLLKLATAFINTPLSERFAIFNLLKLAGYDDDHREKVEEAAKKNPKPFASWFNGRNRLYLDFSAPSNISEEKISFKNPVITDQLELHGYQITDVINGYCQKDGRVFKIGKILNKIKDEELAKLGDSKYKESILTYWKDVINEFINDPNRTNKKNIKKGAMVVISQDPHDIAKSSYERNWASCTNINESERIFCEVETGGLIAYLITAEDLEIENPLARVLIRRFISPDGVNVAIPESKVYGNAPDGFLQFIKSFAEQKNSTTLKKTKELEIYRMRGMAQSDTFLNTETYNDEKVYVHNLPQDLDELIELLLTPIDNIKVNISKDGDINDKYLDPPKLIKRKALIELQKLSHTLNIEQAAKVIEYLQKYRIDNDILLSFYIDFPKLINARTAIVLLNTDQVDSLLRQLKIRKSEKATEIEDEIRIKNTEDLSKFISNFDNLNDKELMKDSNYIKSSAERISRQIINYPNKDTLTYVEDYINKKSKIAEIFLEEFILQLKHKLKNGYNYTDILTYNLFYKLASIYFEQVVKNPIKKIIDYPQINSYDLQPISNLLSVFKLFSYDFELDDESRLNIIRMMTAFKSTLSEILKEEVARNAYVELHATIEALNRLIKINDKILHEDDSTKDALSLIMNPNKQRDNT